MRTENLANFKYTNSHFYFEKVEKEISKVLLVQQRSLFVGPKAAASLSLLFFWTNIEVVGRRQVFLQVMPFFMSLTGPISTQGLL